MKRRNDVTARHSLNKKFIEIIITATKATSTGISIEQLRQFIVDRFMHETLTDIERFFLNPEYDNEISKKMIIICTHLRAIGRNNAYNIVRGFEKQPLLDTGIHTKTVAHMIKEISMVSFVCMEVFNEFTHETICEFQEMCEIKIEKLYRPEYINFDEKALVNLSNVQIPEDVAIVLSFGPKFCFPPKDNVWNTVELVDDFCAHMENSFPIETHFEAYKQFAIEFNLRSKIHRVTRELWLDFLHYRVKKFFLKHDNLLVARSDKGKHTVVIEKDTYYQKLKALVESTTDYERINDIDIKKLEDKNNRFVKILIKNYCIEEDISYLYKDFTCFPAQLYGLFKVHKVGLPLRPIVSACAAPGFKLAKFISELLSTVFWETGFHIKDSSTFVKRIKNLEISESDILISYDVVSMFTNLPIDHIIDIVHSRENEIMERFGLRFDTLKIMLLFLLKECAFFSFDKTLYRQKDSLAMGSPLSPILAKILMTHLIECSLKKLSFKPKFLGLYVDDSLWVVNVNQVSAISAILNEYHPKIKFTLEKEVEGTINFLDVQIIRKKNELITNWWSKPFASSRLLNYVSHHERACITETARAFIIRVLSLSDGRFFHENKSKLEHILRMNSFPETEIIALLRENYTYMIPQRKSEGYDGQYVPIKFRSMFTSRLKKKIQPFLQNARLVGTPDRCDSKHFSYLKDVIDLANKINVILIATCQCKKKKILRHTKFKQRANTCLETIPPIKKELKCKQDAHVIHHIEVIQCKNSTSTQRKYKLLNFYFRKLLLDTEKKCPIFKIKERNGRLILRTK